MATNIFLLGANGALLYFQKKNISECHKFMNDLRIKNRLAEDTIIYAEKMVHRIEEG